MASVLADSPVPPHPSGHRNIVLALDKTEDSEKILRWARQYHKPGDVLHIAHVAKVVGHKDEIFHGPVGTSIDFHEKSLDEVKTDIEGTKAWFRDRIKELADLQDVECIPYLYVEDTSATSAALAKIIGDLADKVHADCIVAAKSNKTAWEKFTVGSTARALLGSSHTVVLVAS
ncbi:hypothetical protein COCOBI_04-4320 [Coccomyxa sp. Obi]|nr:hypothetical protein COCOBI_04-4320 [Coccomyxa sp. Obi]